MLPQKIFPIGRVQGPGADLHTFVFLGPDSDQQLKTGEFVTYETDVDGVSHTIYGRIQRRKPVRLYPDSFALDPDIPPMFIAEMLGYQEAGFPLFAITVGIIGYHDPDLRDFINPRIEPVTGASVFLASDAALTAVLNKRQLTEIGAVHIGSLLSRSAEKVPIVLDGAALAGIHLAIIASTGAGKSYLTGVIIEELLQAHNRAAILVIDPHSEYGTLTQLPQAPTFKNSSYRPHVQLFTPGQVKIAPSSLFVSDLAYLLPDLSEKMRYLLERAYHDVRRQSKHQNGRWTMSQLVEQVRQLGENNDKSDLKGYGRTAEALIWRLESVLGKSGIFHDDAALSLNQLYQPGQATILQLHEMGEREQQVLVAALLRRLLWARTQTEKGQFEPTHPLYLPYPVFVVVEEAHRFAPAEGDVVSSGVLKEVLGEGRKFGVGLALVSQRPGKLDGDVLSQCNTHCLLRIVNDVDQRKVAESVETVGRDLLQELPALTKGQVIVAGEAITTPVLCQVRSRQTPHGANTLNAPAVWVDYNARKEIPF